MILIITLLLQLLLLLLLLLLLIESRVPRIEKFRWASPLSAGKFTPQKGKSVGSGRAPDFLDSHFADGSPSRPSIFYRLSVPDFQTSPVQVYRARGAGPFMPSGASCFSAAHLTRRCARLVRSEQKTTKTYNNKTYNVILT